MTPETYSLITDYLSRFYDVALFTRHGVAHPVVQYDPPPAQRNNVDSVLGHLTTDPTLPDDMAFYNYAYLHSLQNSGRNLFNGTTYTLRRLQTGKQLRIDAGIGSYFDMIATSIALERELLDVISAGMVRLPMRAQYHRTLDAQQTLRTGKGRSAALGGVVLVVFKHPDDNQYYALVSQRTAQHATRAGALHLVPAFMFQPRDAAHADTDWTFKHHIYREYLEELVGMPENTTDSMAAHPALTDLQTLENKGQATIQLTGVSMNLLTLRAEISALLLIHDAKWWANLQSGEHGYHLETPESAGALLQVPIATDDALLAALPKHYYTHMVPQAIPALWAGVDAARTAIEAHETNTP